MLGRTDHRGRTFLLLLAMAVFAVAAALRLAFWQVQQGPELRAQAKAQLEQTAELSTERGRILDRNGRVLALTVYRDRLVAYPKLLVQAWSQDETEAARAGVLLALTRALRLDEAGQARMKAVIDDGETEYAVLDRRLTEAQSLAVKAELALPEGERTLFAVALEPVALRMYPNEGGEPGTTLASHLLGFVTSSGRGAYGIEEQYDEALAGIPTIIEAASDPAGRPLGGSARVITPGQDGTDIHLTIDAGLQLQLEKELLAARNADGAKRVSALIMDPDTGEILAWASVPGYDANDYATQWSRNKDAFRDPILSGTYEPGSVMKMFTAAAALDARKVTLGRLVLDSAMLRFPPSNIVRNADHEAMGWIPFRDVIAYSRNVATARTAAKLGRSVPRSSAVLYRMWTRLGLGQPTGIDLANEEMGIVRDPAQVPWAPLDLANRSFGQGVSITQMQLAAGYTPMINGGFRVTPHFLRAVDGQEAVAPSKERVLPERLSGQLHSVLDHVTSAVPSYARGSLIPGYQVGGKTGTAQIWLPDKGRYSNSIFNFSFVGYVGGDMPGAVVAVRIEEAKAARSQVQGAIKINLTSYQLFRRIALQVISTLDLRRSTFPGAGFPEPLSAADVELTPKRYADHLAQKRKGVNLLAQVRDRYLPGGGDAIASDPPQPTGKAPTGDQKDTTKKPAATKNGKGSGAHRQERQERQERKQRRGAASTPEPSPAPNG